MKKSKIVGTIVAAILIVVGVFVVVYNAIIVYNCDLKYLSYKNVEGTISVVQSTYIDSKVYYKATYSFVVNGTSYSCDSDFTLEEDKYFIGDIATVRYDESNPNNCYLVSNSSTWNYLYLAIACLVLIIGIQLFDKQTRVK